MTFESSDWIRFANNDGAENDLFDEESMAILEAQLEELSFAYQGTDSEKRLVPSNFPGYLYTTLNGFVIFVPWPLVRSFPTSKQLAELLNLASRHSLGESSHICLSGSSAGAGNEVQIGDIDYCEYSELLPPSFIALAEQYRADPGGRDLIRLRYGKVNAEAPKFAGLDGLRAVMASHDTIELAERFMVEFLASTVLWGSLPLSTVVLSCDFKDRRRGTARQSFVFQEAVIARVASAPWSLITPSELGDYIRFLAAQIDGYKVSKPLKALKRALSLSYTVRLFSFVDEILELLLSEEAASYICEDRDAESRRFEAMRDDLDPRQIDTVPELDALFAQQCRALVDRLMHAFREAKP